MLLPAKQSKSTTYCRTLGEMSDFFLHQSHSLEGGVEAFWGVGIEGHVRGGLGLEWIVGDSRGLADDAGVLVKPWRGRWSFSGAKREAR